MTNAVYKVLHSIMGSLEVSSLNSLHGTQCGNVSRSTKQDEGQMGQLGQREWAVGRVMAIAFNCEPRCN